MVIRPLEQTNFRRPIGPFAAIDRVDQGKGDVAAQLVDTKRHSVFEHLDMYRFLVSVIV